MFSSLSKSSHSISSEIKDSKVSYRVSIDDARANPEYALIMENMFLEQATRIVQRVYRKKHGKDVKTVYQETLKSDLILRFIHEPVSGVKAIEHAKRIKANQWIKLDFEEIEFERNLYKALRLGRVTADEMVTANLLFHARNLFTSKGVVPTFKQYRYDEKGPYHPKKIHYATPESLFYFYQQLTRLPEHERFYFTINCPSRYEYIFLYDGIRKPNCWTTPKFVEIMLKYVAKLSMNSVDKNSLFQAIEIMANNHTDDALKKRLEVDC